MKSSGKVLLTCYDAMTGAQGSKTVTFTEGLMILPQGVDTITSGGLAEVIADHRSLLDAIERCDLAAFEPLVEKHLYGGIRRLGSKLTEEYADYFEPEK